MSHGDQMLTAQSGDRSGTAGIKKECLVTDTDERPVEALSTGELVTRISERVSHLVQDELHLAQAEMTEKGRKAGRGAGWLGGGGLVAVFGLACLVAAAVLGLATAIADWLAAVIIGLVLLLVAACAARLGKRRLAEATPPLPTEAVQDVRTDVQTVKQGWRR